MKAITQNPFRVVGILANASAREVQSQRNRIAAYARVGKPIDSDYDFSFLPSLSRDSDTINKAFSDIQQNQDKVNHSLFWLLNTSHFDEAALGYLKTGDKEKAIAIWEQVTDGRSVNSTNFSAFNNLGTLYFLSKSKQEMKKGIDTKFKLLDSEYLHDFVHHVTDPSFKIDPKAQAEIFIEDLLKQLNNSFTPTEKLSLFKNCNAEVQQHLSKKFAANPIHNIEFQIEKAKKRRLEDDESAYKYGKKLFQNTADDLAFLKKLLGVSDLKYKMLADNLAREILQCGIDYFNAHSDLDSAFDFPSKAIKLARKADGIAVSGLIKGRIKDGGAPYV